MLAFCCRATSPAYSTCEQLMATLSNELSDYWAVVRGSIGWSVDKYAAASATTLQLIGSLMLRSVFVFETMLPWRLSVFVHDGMFHDAPAFFAETRSWCDKCCDSEFSADVVRHLTPEILHPNRMQSCGPESLRCRPLGLGA